MEISGVGPSESYDGDGDGLPPIPPGTVKEAIAALEAIRDILEGANYGTNKPISPHDLEVIARSIVDIHNLEKNCSNLAKVLGMKSPGYDRGYQGTYSKFVQQATDYLRGTNKGFAKTFATYADEAKLCGGAASAGWDWLFYQYPH